MFNPFKNLFAPKSVVALAVDSRTIKAVRMVNSPKGLEVTNFVLKEIEDPKKIGDELRAVFKTGEFDHEILVSCILSSQAAIRHFPVVFDNANTLSKIIKYQLEPHVPHPIEEMVVDFLPAAADKEVIAAGVRKSEISNHLQSLSEAGLEPGLVGIDDLALSFLYNHIHKKKGRAVAVLNLGNGKTGVQIISDRGIEFIRVLPGEADAITQLGDTFKLYSYKHEDEPLGEILLTGCIDGDPEEVRTAVESLTGVKTSLWRPLDHLEHRLGEIPAEVQGRLSALLGLAVGALSPSMRVFDLRKEEFTLRSAVGVRKNSFFFVVAFIVIALFTSNLYFKLHVQEKRFQQVEKTVQQVFRKNFPEITTVVKGRELAQMKQKIDAAKGESQWLDNINKEGTTLDMLSRLTRVVVEFQDVAVENISIEGNEIRLDGYASSFETVDKLEKGMNGAASFRSVKLVGAKMDTRESAVRFQFSMERK